MSEVRNPIRCLLGMLGTDVHTKGIRTLAQLLRDQGVEVIYLGEHNTCEGMVNALIAEDPDILGLSFSSSAYVEYLRQLTTLMKQKGVGDTPVMVGGLVHVEDHDTLARMGITGIFGPGSQFSQIVEFIQRATGKSLA
jgi:methylmalonyl-CoA mutase C-terminal domain/subunit